MIARLWKRFKAHDARMTERMSRLADVETFGVLMFAVIGMGVTWLIVWNIHIIAPWLDDLLGIGPHDIDSPGKVRWRRIYSSAFFGTGIFFATLQYVLNVRDRKSYQSQIEARRKEMEERGKEGKEISIHPPIDSSSPKPPSVNSKDQTEAE